MFIPSRSNKKNKYCESYFLLENVNYENKFSAELLVN